ncbi:MBL fold metallo-hydrolase [Acinetobacter larvae]|uniref:MBL fold metallo-hydrolase n=1 Tax=Acinetobacter larvae TaxID=1789224 RepID=A0A1B2LW63_9GAMM|nr:MBL fold metallo-hydrolase [Acinetobacter larvae]AOA57180.1 MBL fold metallo-hydrolase [Acinetobacter larvae]
MQQIADIQAFFDPQTHSFSYVVADPVRKQCAVIDSVLNFDPVSATTTTVLADQIIAYIEQQQLQLQWILETHVHADHLTAAQYLKQKLGGCIAMSQQIARVQQRFAQIYQLEAKPTDFDYLFADQERFYIGELAAYTLATPGHTPACLSYVVADAIFVGDTLFMPDYGTARCDFPDGDAAELYASIQKIYQFPAQTRLFLCHDYLPLGREQYGYQTDVGRQKQHNIHIHQGIALEDFVAMRQQRDAQLSMPRLMLMALPINMQAGRLPPCEDNGIAYLKIPLNYF